MCVCVCVEGELVGRRGTVWSGEFGVGRIKFARDGTLCDKTGWKEAASAV